MAVYFIGTKEGPTLLRVGYSANVRARFGQHQAFALPPLELLAEIESGAIMEAWVHWQLKPWHHQREWYRDTPEARELIHSETPPGELTIEFLAPPCATCSQHFVRPITP